MKWWTLLVAIVLVACDGGGSFGGASLSALIKLKDRDEADIIASLRQWMIGRGYVETIDDWGTVTGGASLNLVGPQPSRHLQSKMFVLNFDDGTGHHAWGVVPSSDADPYIRIFHHTDVHASTDKLKEELIRRVAEEERAFHEFVEEKYPFNY